jgi:hypothetical protein
LEHRLLLRLTTGREGAAEYTVHLTCRVLFTM